MNIFSNSLIPGLWYIVLALFVLLILVKRKQKKNFPDGPWGVPLLGYLPFITRMPHLKLYELSQVYGPIFSLKLGLKNVVVLSNAKTVQEAFGKAALLGRPEISVFKLADITTPFFENGQRWEEQRRFAMQTIKELMLGKSVMHDSIIDEICHFVDVLGKAEGQPISLNAYLVPSVSNNICNFIFGRRYEYDDPSRKMMDESLDNVTKILGQTAYQLFFPSLVSLPFGEKLLKVEQLRKYFYNFTKFSVKEIEEHKSTLDTSHPKDYIDTFLNEMSSNENDYLYNEKVLIGCVNNLFGGGTETIQATLNWAMYAMAAYPAIQSKVRNEIDNVIGYDRNPAFTDRNRMPYTQSVLLEVQRHFTILPLGLLRCVLDDTTICGYDIPKGMYVLSNLWAVHHDPSCWEHPDRFNPDRFLSEDGEYVIKPDAFMPFSYGKRNCPGEGLATLEIFLYFTAVLQMFTIGFPDDYIADFKGELHITYHLKNNNLRFFRRH